MLSQLLKQQGKTETVFFQPRMGVKSLEPMAAGLKDIKARSPVGTLTLDSFSRKYDYKSLRNAMNSSSELNGFPLIFYKSDEIKKTISSLQDHNFLIQVRHGMADPYDMITHMIRSGLVITEGGPISYCLPYSRLPLEKSLCSWQRSTRLLAEHNGHLETFSGCMMGQLSPPSLLIALNIIEGLFFAENGLTDVSFSYAQSYDIHQDYASVCVLKKLMNHYLSSLNSHVVIYTFMGIYPETKAGHKKILHDSYRLARASQSQRLIYKTEHESFRIPTISENIAEFDDLTNHSKTTQYEDIELDLEEYNHILHEADMLIQQVINLSDDLNTSILAAFNKGILDIPYCLHPQNKGNTRSWIETNGYVRWHHPLIHQKPAHPSQNSEISTNMTSQLFLENLYFNRTKYDTKK